MIAPAPSPVPTREEIAEIVHGDSHGVPGVCGTIGVLMKPCSVCERLMALLARLRPAWPTHLPDGALEAIAVEHERDHSDVVRAEPREGCNGCKMLSHAFALRADLEREKEVHRLDVALVLKLDADLRACAEALRAILPAVEMIARWIGSHRHELHSLTETDWNGFQEVISDARTALARPGCRDALK